MNKIPFNFFVCLWSRVLLWSEFGSKCMSAWSAVPLSQCCFLRNVICPAHTFLDYYNKSFLMYGGTSHAFCCFLSQGAWIGIMYCLMYTTEVWPLVSGSTRKSMHNWITCISKIILRQGKERQLCEHVLYGQKCVTITLMCLMNILI